MTFILFGNHISEGWISRGPLKMYINKTFLNVSTKWKSFCLGGKHLYEKCRLFFFINSQSVKRWARVIEASVCFSELMKAPLSRQIYLKPTQRGKARLTLTIQGGGIEGHCWKSVVPCILLNFPYDCFISLSFFLLGDHNANLIYSFILNYCKR